MSDSKEDKIRKLLDLEENEEMVSDNAHDRMAAAASAMDADYELPAHLKGSRCSSDYGGGEPAPEGMNDDMGTGISDADNKRESLIMGFISIGIFIGLIIGGIMLFRYLFHPEVGIFK